jgi:CubicO group peptidase (beta-lactamase class C family)
MQQRFFLLMGALILLSGAWLARGPGLALTPPPDFGKLERVARAELKETHTPGAAVAIISGDRVVFAKGFGVASAETGAPVTPETLFQLGSMTKTFTAAALVALAEEGKLKLDAPIGDYVAGLSAKLAQVTAHQLLSHTAGLKDEPDDYGLHDESALGAYARSWKDDYCLLAPGQVFSYSNSGFALAGLALEAAGGKPYAEQMNERLFQPLGMMRTTFRPTMAMTYPLAVGHRARGKEPPTVVRPMADDARLWPAGNMFSSVNDLARFAIAFLNGGKLEGKPALSPAVIAKLATPHTDIPSFAEETRYGYGLLLNQHRGVR